MSQLTPRFDLAVTLSGVASNTPICQLIGSVANARDSCSVRSISVEFLDTTAATLALVRPFTLGTPTTLVTPQSLSRGSSSAALATAWSVAPTLSSPTYLQEFKSVGIAGTQVTWLFDEDAPLDVGTGIALANVLGTVCLWNVGVASSGSIIVSVSLGSP